MFFLGGAMSSASWWSDFQSFLAIPLVSLLIGAAITWYFSRLYYVRSGRELKEKAEQLSRLSELLLRLVETQGLGQKVTVNRDLKGAPTGLVNHAELHDSIQGGVTIIGGKLTSSEPDNSQ